VAWSLADSDTSLQPGIAVKLSQMGDISSEVTLEGWKFDLVHMRREKGDTKEDLVSTKVIPPKFKKSSVTGKIAVVEPEPEPSPPKKSKIEKKSTATTSAAKKKSSKKSKRAESEEESEEEETKPVMKSVIRKGLAPVDPDCPHQEKYHVFTEGRDVWDCMLNQTNIQNNNNKYYLIQLLEADSGKSYAVWMRWGRVGYSGQNSWTVTGSDLDKAKAVFAKKFKDKTVNEWEERDSFEKRAGKYDLVLMDYSAKDEVDSVDSSVKKSDPEESKPESVPDSKLEQRVQDLIKLICDIKTMEQSVIEMEYDTKKAPLGKITTEQIKAGYAALKDISDSITAGKTSGKDIIQACNDFYTRIPHEFGFRTPPIIRTHADVKKKLELLETLADIQVALKILSAEQDTDTNPIDRHYQQLKVEIEAMSAESKERKLVESSIMTTHAPTHSNYSMDILDVFKLDKDTEDKKFVDVGNRKLLYHGSRLSNWAGILGQGLRIAPPEAPVTGYMFGKGVYFADMSSKSANYCFTNRSNNIGLLLICEVALGTPNKLLGADYEADKLPKGCSSVLGQGKTIPSTEVDCDAGLKLPQGPPKKTAVDNKKGYTLQYNEYIVYNTNQIKMKYLAKIKFNHKY